MPSLQDLVAASGDVAATRSRRAKSARLADMLRALDAHEVEIATAMLAGELRQGRVGLGASAVSALRGELGPPPAQASLSLAEVDARFDAIAALSGSGARTGRQRGLAELLERATADERDFLARLVIGELRQGALEGLLVDAVAQAYERPVDAVRRATMLGSSLPAVAVAARAGSDLSEFRLELLRPVQPMLAASAPTASEAIDALERPVLEWKLDGARVQLHRDGEAVRVFTRQGNDVTSAVPELVGFARALPAERAVLDGEVIALRDDGRPHPFQTTMRRFGRKRGAAGLDAELPLTPFFFDVLHCDGEDWIDRTYADRRARLAALVPEAARLPSAEPADPDEAEAFFASALAAGHEGILAKDAASLYAAGRRGAAWIKVKPAKTLDLVVLAADWGSGRRKGWLSNLHLGARDEKRGGFAIVGKTFKGMTDATLERQTEELQAIATHAEGHTVHVRPERVVEVAIDGVQESPHYAGGAALRFARLRGYRDDKPADEADTLDTVRALAGLGPA